MQIRGTSVEDNNIIVFPYGHTTVAGSAPTSPQASLYLIWIEKDCLHVSEKSFTFKIIIRQYLFANDISDSHFGHSYVFGKLSASSPWHACLKFIIVAKNTRKQFEEREPKGGANPDILFQLDFLYLRFLVLYSLKEEKTYSWKLTGKNVTWKLPLSCEAPFCLLPVMNMRVLSFYRLTALSVRLLLT